MDRGDLSDAEWELIGTLLPPERGRWARPAGDNRRFLNGMLHVLRVGCPWRDMHERYGKWNSVYELAHVRNRDTLVMTMVATIAGAISMIANFGMFFGHDEEGRPNPAAAILAMIVAPFAAMIVQMAISRTREYGADKAGAEICGNPAALASALAKIAGPAQQLPSTANSNPAAAQLYIVPTGISDLFSTHPATEKRIAALQAMNKREPRSALDPLRQG